MFILRWHFFLFFLGSSIRLQPKPLNRFSRIIRQKNRFGPRRCLLGVKNFPKNFLTPKGGKNPLSHAFQWETKMLITFEPVSRSSWNLVCSIRGTGATSHYAQKPEIPKTRWPPTPCWIFMHSWITQELYIQFSPNFNPSFVSSPGRRFLGQKSNFAKSKMAAGLRMKFTNMAIAPKREVRNGPSLAEIIPYRPAIGKFREKFEFWNPRWPPAAILKNTKNAITRKRFDRLPPNFNPRFVSAPRTRFWGQKWNFAKSKMAAGLRLKFTNMAITWEPVVRNGPNLAGIILFGPAIGKCHQNFEFQNPRWSPTAILKKKLIAFINIPIIYNKTANINVKN